MSELRDDLAALKIERTPEKIGRRGGLPIGWIVAVLLLGGGGYAAYAFATRVKPVEVEVATVSMRAVGGRAQVLTGNGYVTARRRATVSSKITGKVIEINVEEGKAVTQGQILARLDPSTAQAALSLAEAQADSARRQLAESDVRLAEAKVTLSRLVALLKDGIVTQADVDATRANVDSIEARILAAKTQVVVAERQIAVQKTDIDNTIIRAPFSGIAISKDAQPGEMVSPVSAGGGFTRTGICTIVDMSSLEIEVDVNETYIDRVRSGQDVLATLNAYPEWQIPARVITTIPAGDRQKATVLVRIGFNQLDPRILPDMGVKVSFLRPDEGSGQPEVAAQPVTLVPKAALKTEGSATIAFVVQGDAVERRAVTIGGTDGDRVEVKAGLRNGERVVMSPPQGLADGVKIQIK
jgi:RND family efflux transporter MFP subunit